MHDIVLSTVIRDVSTLLQQKMFNEVLYLSMTKKVDYKNFSKIVDLRVKRLTWTGKLKNIQSPKFCETEIINRYHEKKMVDTHFKTWLCVKNSVREKNEGRLTSGTMMVNDIERKKVQKIKSSVGIM